MHGNPSLLGDYKYSSCRAGLANTDALIAHRVVSPARTAAVSLSFYTATFHCTNCESKQRDRGRGGVFGGEGEICFHEDYGLILLLYQMRDDFPTMNDIKYRSLFCNNSNETNKFRYPFFFCSVMVKKINYTYRTFRVCAGEGYTG